MINGELIVDNFAEKTHQLSHVHGINQCETGHRQYSIAALLPELVIRIVYSGWRE